MMLASSLTAPAQTPAPDGAGTRGGERLKLVLIVLLLLPLYGICIPLYRKLNPAGFTLYLAWSLFCGIVWVRLVLFGI